MCIFVHGRALLAESENYRQGNLFIVENNRYPYSHALSFNILHAAMAIACPDNEIFSTPKVGKSELSLYLEITLYQPY